MIFFGSGRFQPTEKWQNNHFECRRYDIYTQNIVPTALKRGNYYFCKGLKPLATEIFYAYGIYVNKPIIPIKNVTH
jgi:hypothetical protein